MKPVLTLTGLLAGVFGTTQSVQAADIIHCRQVSGSHNGGDLTELRIYKTEDGGYGYHAVKCERWHGSFCMSTEYYSYGPITREFYNGFPTLVFKNDEVKTFPSSGRSQVFVDEKNGAGFVFLSQDCSIAAE